MSFLGTYDNASDEADKDISHRLDLNSKRGSELADNDTDNHANDDPDGEIGVLPHQSETIGDRGEGSGEFATLLGLIRVDDGLGVVGGVNFHTGGVIVFFCCGFGRRGNG
jgi:hypothetical protein